MPRLRIDAAGSVGYSTDLNPVDAPAQGLQLMRNVLCEDRKLIPVPGEKVALEDPALALPGPMHEHFTYKDVNGLWWGIWSIGTIIYAGSLDGGSNYVALLTGLTSGCRVTFCDLNGILVANSDKDGPYYCPGMSGTDLDTLDALPGWDANWTCDFMTSYRYNLVACGMTESGTYYPHKVRWSGSAAEGDLPTVWTAALTNDAGSDLIGDTPGYPTTAVQVRDALWIVKEDAIHEMRYVGGQFVMALSHLEGSIGTAVPRGVAPLRSGAAIFDGSDLYYFNGQSSQSLTDDRVRTEIEKSVYRGNLGLAEVFNNSRDNKLYLAIPTSSEEYNTKAYVLNYVDNTWGSYDTDRLYGFGLAQVVDATLFLGYDDCAAVTYDVDGLTLTYSSGASLAPDIDLVIFRQAHQPVAGSYRDAIFYCNDSMYYENFLSFNEPIACEVMRYGIPLVSTTGKCVVTEAWPEVLRGAVKIWFGAHDTAKTPPSVWDGPYTADVNDVDPKTPLVSGRYFAFKVTDTSEIIDSGPPSFIATPGERFEFSGLTVSWEPDGEF